MCSVVIMVIKQIIVHSVTSVTVQLNLLGMEQRFDKNFNYQEMRT